MNEIITQDGRPSISDPFGRDDGGWGGIDAASGALAVSGQQESSSGDQDALMVQIMRHAYSRPRRMERVRQLIQATARTMDITALRYSWFVKDRKSGGKTEISGPTIKCAMMVARCYGNCYVGARLKNEGVSHWNFQGVFIDFETGFLVLRDFQQRKGQDTGMSDRDRAADIIFQIGLSKATRNVIVNALGPMIDFALEEGSSQLRDWVAADPARAKAKINEYLAALGIELKVVQGIRGRVIANWTVPDLVLTLSELRAIMEGQASIEDIYGDPDVAARRGDADEAERAEVKAAAKTKVDGRTKEAREAKARAEAGAAAAAGQDANGQPVGEADVAGMDELPSQAAEGKVAATPTEPVLEDRSAQQTAQGGSAGANADGPAGGDEKRPPAPPAKLLFGDRG